METEENKHTEGSDHDEIRLTNMCNVFPVTPKEDEAYISRIHHRSGIVSNRNSTDASKFLVFYSKPTLKYS